MDILNCGLPTTNNDAYAASSFRIHYSFFLPFNHHFEVNAVQFHCLRTIATFTIRYENTRGPVEKWKIEEKEI